MTLAAQRRTTRREGLALAGLLALAPLPAAGAESAYTKLDLDACTTLAEREEEAGVDLECPGYAGLSVFVSEGDLRTDVDFGAPDEAFSTFGPFNAPGGTVEWRHEGGRPFAAILRFHLDRGTGEPGAKGDVLLVAKVGTRRAPGCPVALVDVAGVEAPNGVARGAAALAPLFRCGRDRPVAIGGPGGLAAQFTDSLPEGLSPDSSPEGLSPNSFPEGLSPAGQ